MGFDVRLFHKQWPEFNFHIMWTLLLFSALTQPARTQHNASLLVAKFLTITTELMPRPVAMIKHPLDGNRVVYAGQTAVYVITLSSKSQRLIAGGTVQGYSEGESFSVKFMAITAIVSGPDPAQQTILVTDYGAGCIRQVDLKTQRTKRIFGDCSANPDRGDSSNNIKATTITQDPNDSNIYYFGEKAFVRQLRRLRNGNWKLQNSGWSLFVILNKKTLLWNYDIIYVVGTKAIWTKLFIQETVDNLVNDLSWNARDMSLSSAIIHQNKWLVATDKSNGVFRVVDLRTKATFSLCGNFGKRSCALRDPAAIIENPLKSNSYLVAGRDLYEVDFQDAEKGNNTENWQTSATDGTTLNIATDRPWASLVGIAVYSFIGSVSAGFIGAGIYIYYVYHKRQKKKKRRESCTGHLSRYRPFVKN